MISVLIADDQTLMRDGLQTILSLQEDIRVVGMAKNGEEVPVRINKQWKRWNFFI